LFEYLNKNGTKKIDLQYFKESALLKIVKILEKRKNIKEDGYYKIIQQFPYFEEINLYRLYWIERALKYTKKQEYKSYYYEKIGFIYSQLGHDKSFFDSSNYNFYEEIKLISEVTNESETQILQRINKVKNPSKTNSNYCRDLPAYYKILVKVHTLRKDLKNRDKYIDLLLKISEFYKVVLSGKKYDVLLNNIINEYILLNKKGFLDENKENYMLFEILDKFFIGRDENFEKSIKLWEKMKKNNILKKYIKNEKKVYIYMLMNSSRNRKKGIKVLKSYLKEIKANKKVRHEYLKKYKIGKKEYEEN
jgi:hypothetical protein